MQTILVATDGSICGQQAEDEGVELAVATGARLVFLHVQPEGDPSRSQPGTLSEETDESHALLDRALAKAVEAGVYAESEIVEGNPGREIVDAARLRGADIIVVGSRGHGKLSSMFLGSVSHDVLSEADRPVLIVKEKRVP
ncbi:MAG: universal stress protein [Gaiellaceae bacterium]|jgi:nucleotide-binding universal stress UspA family protein